MANPAPFLSFVQLHIGQKNPPFNHTSFGGMLSSDLFVILGYQMTTVCL
jgi:hypothetical protein